MKSKYSNRYSDAIKQEAIMRIIGGIRLSQVAKETGYYSSDLKYLGKRI